MKNILVIGLLVIVILVSIAGALYYSNTKAQQAVVYIEEAQRHLTQMHEIHFAATEPSDADIDRFKKHAVAGQESAAQAMKADKDNAEAWAVRGNIYSLLLSAKLEEAYEPALADLSHAQALEPENPSHYESLATLELRADNPEGVRVYLQEAYELDPKNATAVYALSRISGQLGDLDQAITLAYELVALQPNQPKHYFYLGSLEANRGDNVAAAAAFEEAIALDPNYANAHYFLALAYIEEGRDAEAILHLKHVFALNPGNLEVQTLLKELGADTEQ